MRWINNLLVASLLAPLILAPGCSRKEEARTPAPEPVPIRALAPQSKSKVNPVDSIFEVSAYTIKPGSKLYDVANKLYGTPRMAHAIADWNGIDLWQIDGSYKADIHPGDSLNVKDVDVKYVQEGDSWWRIARATGLSVQEAQNKFHWIGKTPNPGEIYYLE